MNGSEGAGVLDFFREILHFLLALPPQATDFAARVDDLQYVEITVFWAIGGALFGVTALFVARYREGPGRPPPERTPRVTAPRWLEIGLASLLLSLFVGWWVWGFFQYSETQVVEDDAYEVYVTAKQWMWKFDYPEGRSTAGVLFVPEGRPVRLLLTSRDVIHSFFVPDFRIKQDAVPGRWLTLNFRVDQPGDHQILCSELCGVGHSRMWGRVVVLPAEEFDRWLALGAAPESLAEEGRRVAAEKGCSGCHSEDGTVLAAPTWLGLWGTHEPLENGDSAFVDAAYLTESMMDPLAKVVRGFLPVMPSYQGELTPGQAAALVEYIRALGPAGGGQP
jgi:cytochrome c oxidase subunit II